MGSKVGPRADGLLDFEVVHLSGAGAGDLKWTPSSSIVRGMAELSYNKVTGRQNRAGSYVSHQHGCLSGAA